LRARIAGATNCPQAGQGHWYKHAAINRLTPAGNLMEDKRMSVTPKVNPISGIATVTAR